VTQKNAFLYTEGVIAAILQKMNGCSKPMVKFISTIIPQWWSISGRYNFMNISRYSNYAEQSIRNAFERGFNFFRFNYLLVQEKDFGAEKIVVFDPSYIYKSGKKTAGIGRFWSGTAQEALPGLEIGELACVDVVSGTAFHLEAIQTPNNSERNGKSMVTHYADSILARMPELLAISKHLVVDGYFMKKDFIIPIKKAGIHVITKMRSDANLCYPVGKEDQPKGRGRKRIKGNKINLKKIDKRKWTLVDAKDNIEIYTTIAYCVSLKEKVRIVYILDLLTQRYEVFLSTDMELSGDKILAYYKLRFQIEFLLRDAKQHAGLEDCQARSKNKLYFHFNISLTSVSVAKVCHYLSIPREDRKAFSLQSIKRLYHNKLLTETIFDNLDLDLNCRKIKRLYQKCLDFGRIAA
jgi:hypothetical protein